MNEIVVFEKDEYQISTDKNRLDVELIYKFLTTSYWSPGIQRDEVNAKINGAECFGLYNHQGAQLGFARVITDYVAFGYLADVFILDEARGQGLGKWLVRCTQNHPRLKTLRRWLLATKDAHTLYAQCNFTPLQDPNFFMTICSPDIRSLTEE